ncbi:MarR family transcriptional regulator [Altererythrobacter sp. CC-YST694]|uniref:MarR family winged helix-turn-helix transcriptional regulator n=1 Tax=Altererythrobacter sp. CC-YST694 TaxID=2755038 RepID=UPI001D02DE01|nr:MarR family transcriptional regulator [Altererythrobacter sp. CC-YST694]MCB5426034.1 MarR family transcriptional regulator [Altererythrobacter sp. CC-YST694]
MAGKDEANMPPDNRIMPLSDEDLPPSYRLGGIAYFGYRLAVTAKLFDRKFMEVLKAHSTLTLPQWRCLAQLGLAEPGTVRSLAEGAVVDRAEVSRALARLIAQGIVQRHDNEGDQRSPHFSLTPEGRALYDRLRKPVSQFIGSLVSQVDKDDIDAADRVLWTLSKGCID